MLHERSEGVDSRLVPGGASHGDERDVAALAHDLEPGVAAQMTGQSTSSAARDKGHDGIPIWLFERRDPVYAVLHASRAGAHTGTAVLILPPFGWEDVCSYRARHYWATELALSGFPTLRLDLPATGDSAGSPHDSNLLSRWDQTARSAVSWLRELPGIERVAVIGLRLGGMLAIRALESGAQIDDLILWGVPAQGRSYLRELKVHSTIVGSASGEADDSHDVPEGALTLTGFYLNPETVADIEGIDLLAAGSTDLGAVDALLIRRDALNPDRRLTERLTAAGARTRTLSASDYRVLMSEPLEPGTPSETVRNTIDWLNARAAPISSATDRPCRPATVETALIETDRGVVTERLIAYDGIAGRMQGILSTTEATRRGDCVLFLNPGRRTGPNRMWTEAARRWAANGVSTVRFDVEGLGDSDGAPDIQADLDHIHAQEMTDQIVEMIDHLRQSGIADRVFIVGLCASAYWALHAALEEPAITGLTLINLWAFEWESALLEERIRMHTAEIFGRGLLKQMRQSWARTGTRGMRTAARAYVKSAWRSGSVEASQKPTIEAMLDRLETLGTDVSFMFVRREPLYGRLERLDLLERIGSSPNLTVELIDAYDHNVRASWVQDLTHRHIDAALVHQIGQSAGAPHATEPRAGFGIR